MREIKFELIFYNGLVDKYVRYDVTLENLLDDNVNIESIHEWINENHTCTSWTDWEYELLKKRQYTGLKDKNGVEIYEEDIIHSETENENYHIRFMNGSFCATCDNGEYKILYEDFTLDRVKVIGNIYENKELLGE